jgi:tRNA threonylcarbamoyladenosine biosynthesis protein TsaE
VPFVLFCGKYLLRMSEFSVTVKGREETARVAAALAPFLHPGDAMMLKGALAGGKTAFVQELVAALGSKADVTSPTFTLAHFYQIPAGTFLHIDAYRLSSVAEFRDLALEDYVPESITAVEWGDIVQEDFSNALSIVFEFVPGQDNWRKLTFSANAERWQPVLESLSKQV